ncbi:Transmembrane protein 255B [Liparis tanakae]|uniref:Transmembrane protein 255B n=1 Tax=Liparis tanakae TaxID=230148 RepID=A0A4Z2HR74_9TELE|nr:Transmembrane protein 255B [Liparis tanakae]
MQQQPPESQPTAAEVVDPAAHYLRRRKAALWVTVSLLALALVVLAVGLISATRTDNVPVAGYYAGITLSFGAFLGIVGIHLVENRRPMNQEAAVFSEEKLTKHYLLIATRQTHLPPAVVSGEILGFGNRVCVEVFYVLAAGAKLVAAIIFISIGVIASFFCAIVDGIIASEFIDIRPLQEDMCDFYTSGAGYAYDSYYTEVTCRSFDKTCKLKLRSNTCYCCYLYNCASTEFHTQYYAFTGVSSCWDVIHLHRLLWASVVLNVLGLFLGIITAAMLGAYKDMLKPTPPVAASPAPPPHILYNPTQHMVTYAGFCPSGQTLPTYPNYPMSMQQPDEQHWSPLLAHLFDSNIKAPDQNQNRSSALLPRHLPIPSGMNPHNSNYQPPATPQMIPEGGTASNACLSEENQSQQPSQPQPQPQGAAQEPGGYMLTPNAPVLYGSAYSAFEKPPPYAC